MRWPKRDWSTFSFCLKGGLNRFEVNSLLKKLVTQGKMILVFFFVKRIGFLHGEQDRAKLSGVFVLNYCLVKFLVLHNENKFECLMLK